MEKMATLEGIIRGADSLAVAFSGGRDSTLLAMMARRILGRDSTVAIFADTGLIPSEDRKDVVDMADLIGIRLEMVEIDPLSISGFRENPPDRCAICKREIMRRVIDRANDLGICRVADGAVADDISDYRPGHDAATKLGVIHPLLEAGVDHEDVERILREEGIPIWNKKPTPCMATRIPTGQRITPRKTGTADNIEKLVRGMGFEYVRLRIIEESDGSLLGVLEVGDPSRAMERWEDIKKGIGELKVVIDPDGYEMGSMNRLTSTRQ